MKKTKINSDLSIEIAARIYSEIAHLKAYVILRSILKGNDAGNMIISERIDKIKKYLSTEIEFLDSADHRHNEILHDIESAVKDSPN